MMIPLYHVEADVDTGEWIGEPEATGRHVETADWARAADNDKWHCDTYQHTDAQGFSETRAIKVFWIDSEVFHYHRRFQ